MLYDSTKTLLRTIHSNKHFLINGTDRPAPGMRRASPAARLATLRRPLLSAYSVQLAF
jgi:hypothetical protein